MSNRQPIAECYRHLIAAIVHQAIKDQAAWFLESPEVRDYCAEVGINTRPVGVRNISHNAVNRQSGN